MKILRIFFVFSNVKSYHKKSPSINFNFYLTPYDVMSDWLRRISSVWWSHIEQRYFHFSFNWCEPNVNWFESEIEVLNEHFENSSALVEIVCHLRLNCGFFIIHSFSHNQNPIDVRWEQQKRNINARRRRKAKRKSY